MASIVRGNDFGYDLKITGNKSESRQLDDNNLTSFSREKQIINMVKREPTDGRKYL